MSRRDKIILQKVDFPDLKQELERVLQNINE